MATNNNLIIGAGLAGCLVAWRLREAGQPFTVIGDCSAPSASMVAGGVINPVTGRWSVKSWRIDELLPAADECYRAIEATFGINIYHQIPLVRYCQNEEDRKRISRRLRNPRYADVLGPLRAAATGPSQIKDDYGSYEIRKAAFVDLPQLLNCLRKQFQVRDEPFDHAALKPDGDHWSYRGFRAKRVIFCDGAGMLQNPFCQDLPLTPIKGETLLLKNEHLLLPRALYHHKKWLLPYGDGTFRLGATYDENDPTSDPTQSGASELLAGLRAFIDSDFQNVDHLAGLRPGTPDTRPLIGQLPNQSGLFVFNGLGSKGASVAPLMSQHFINHLLKETPLDPEVNLARFEPGEAEFSH
ncbi:MAG: FAD-binding oxidoreductase [Coraliomargarita sp.]|nr:FAD-binding oxidoreductase [Coraliomargarita sp.]